MIQDKQNGQALVEFALVLPLLLILLLGTMEFGIILYDKAVVTNASREGARVGIVAQDRTNLTPINQAISDTITRYCSTYLINFGGAGLQPPSLVFSGTSFGSQLTVTVEYRYKFLVLPGVVTSLAGYRGTYLPMRATTVMNLE
jgi:Flp pilus assembly protein TadG